MTPAVWHVWALVVIAFAAGQVSHKLIKREIDWRTALFVWLALSVIYLGIFRALDLAMGK